MTFMFLELSFLATNGGVIRKNEKFRSQVIAVEEKISGAVEPVICRRSGAGHRGRKTKNLLHDGEAPLLSNDN